MFYSQPLATRFGTDLIGQIASGKWAQLDIAVAWVRASGMAHIANSLTQFLQAGNELKVIVGIDLDNTTKEGLEELLRLQSYGNASIFIHHNEAGTIFHPKLYLFRSVSNACLIVGSNNITEAGLFRNTEAGLELDVPIDHSLVTSTLNAIAAWSDPALGLAHVLNKEFLDDLVANGYIKDEATVRAEMAARKFAAKPKKASTKKLFGSVTINAPTRPTTPPPGKQPAVKKAGKLSAVKSSASSSTGLVLLMRVRKARGTQIQIPLAVMRTPFFAGATDVFSIASAVTRGIHPTHAARAGASANPNTLKLEMPETASMTDPVVRFERTSTRVQYEVYDRASPKGKAIMQALLQGQSSKPPSTKLTVPSAPDRATWWRFI